MSTTPTRVDVLIVGAGISGISAAYHVQTYLPNKSYAILEARESLGGTWDLFRYPGIRSDSDMYTLGYSFRPWTQPKAIADGASILNYVRETAEAYGIDKKIRYRHKVEAASWSSDKACWTVDARDTKTNEVTRYECKFLFVCAGYYDYDEGYTPQFEGRERFEGRVVHPQKWTDDVDYANKRVVVIGSGATAVTLVPSLAKKAAHVTMLQRSPTYIVSLPERDKVADWLRERLPAQLAYDVTRWKNVMFGMAFFAYCRKFPEQAKRFILGQVKKALNGTTDLAHFTPKYKPWDQRLCLVPDGDLFKSLHDGKASIVTDEIESFTEKGIRLRSGKELEADLIVTATGLKLKFLGGLALEIDGKRIEPSTLMAYKGIMFSDVPNLAIAIGYTNASWTLKCDLTSVYVCRLLQLMDEKGYREVRPKRSADVEEEPLIGLQSGYVQRALDKFPRQGSVKPWKLYQNYVLDTLLLKRAPVAEPSLRFA